MLIRNHKIPTYLRILLYIFLFVLCYSVCHSKWKDFFFYYYFFVSCSLWHTVVIQLTIGMCS